MTVRERRCRASPADRRARQRGFTLIELLVVISIIGILAALVTLSLVGVTSLAQQRANDEELMTIQSAMNFMIADQHIDPGQACPPGAGPTDDMRRFPVATRYSATGTGQPVALYPHYLRKTIVNRAYVCHRNGSVSPA